MSNRIAENRIVSIGLLCFAAVMTALAAPAHAQTTQPAGPTTEPTTRPTIEFDTSGGTLIAPGSEGFGHGDGATAPITQDDGPGGKLATFPHSGDHNDIGPHGPVFDDGGNAMTIAFVCDASGSMMEKIEALKKELSKTVDALHPFQKFSITFLQDKDPAFLDKDLILAAPENKQKAENFITDVSTTGSTDPIPGIDLAFKQKPELLYFLTDGDFPDNAKVLAEIHKLDPDHKVKINTISFTDSSDKDVAFKKLLKQIATESGGTYKQVKVEDLDMDK